jgi:hypothetical protein
VSSDSYPHTVSVDDDGDIVIDGPYAIDSHVAAYSMSVYVPKALVVDGAIDSGEIDGIVRAALTSPPVPPGPGEEALRDLRDRLAEKVTVLRSMAREAPSQSEADRLRGKAEGVDLAVSFAHEAVRDIERAALDAGQAPEPPPCPQCGGPQRTHPDGTAWCPGDAGQAPPEPAPGRRRTLTIEWVDGDLDEYTEENLDALDALDGAEIGYLLRMGGIDVSDPTRFSVQPSAPLAVEEPETPEATGWENDTWPGGTNDRGPWPTIDKEQGQ